MPHYSCSFPYCNRPVEVSGTFCADHQAEGEQMRTRRREERLRKRAVLASRYDKYDRDPAAKKFYNSKAWEIARTQKLTDCPVCERCQKAWARHVHHIKPLAECNDAEKVAQDNLKAVCPPCHNLEEAELRARKADEAGDDLPFVAGMLQPVEDERFYYDPIAAEKPIEFIEKYCQHYESEFEGQPFKLLQWQKDLIRTLFGWKHKAGRLKGRRRFKILYLITAKGAGKTPLLAGIGLYMLLADGEAAAHVISMASTVEQAHYTFDAGQNYINLNARLSKDPKIRTLQHETEGPKLAKWTTISGEPTGRSGSRPSCLIADEVHEWNTATAKGFELVRKNMFKRNQPLTLMATNAGADKFSYAWQCHERAVAILAGRSDDTTMLPCIFEAPRDLDWRSEEAAKAANPSMGLIRHFEDIKDEREAGENEYRRLYLSQWVSGSEKWLDMDAYDRNVGPIAAGAVAGLPLYVGIDMSNGDDLCAAVFVFASSTKYYVQPWFWLPKATAAHYEEKNGITYSKWGEAGAIELIDDPTISTAVQERIGAQIAAVHKVHPITAVCFDPAYSSNVTATIKKAGIECRRVQQGYTLGDATDDFERRLTEKSIVIEPNPVMRMCATNAEVTKNRHGNRWPVKPMAKNRYAGRREAKIDGISALVTAICEARKHDFPKDAPPPKQWDGLIGFASTRKAG